jgi:hypothetical protein
MSLLSQPPANNVDGVLQQMAELLELIEHGSSFTVWFYRMRFLNLCRYSRVFLADVLQKTRYSDLVIRFKLLTQYNDDEECVDDSKEEPLISFSEQN